MPSLVGSEMCIRDSLYRGKMMKEIPSWRILAVCFFCLLLLMFPPIELERMFLSGKIEIERKQQHKSSPFFCISPNIYF